MTRRKQGHLCQKNLKNSRISSVILMTYNMFHDTRAMIASSWKVNCNAPSIPSSKHTGNSQPFSALPTSSTNCGKFQCSDPLSLQVYWYPFFEVLNIRLYYFSVFSSNSMNIPYPSFNLSLELGVTVSVAASSLKKNT